MSVIAKAAVCLKATVKVTLFPKPSPLVFDKVSPCEPGTGTQYACCLNILPFFDVSSTDAVYT